MAQTRKKTTTAVKSTETVEKQPKVVDTDNLKVEEPKTVVEKKSEVKKFEPSDPITCRSVCQGILNMEGKSTGTMYRFDGYGDEIDIEYRDLLSEARNARSAYIYNPMLIVEDKDFINSVPALKKFYDNYADVTNLRGILGKPVQQMIEAIQELPQGAQDQIKILASTLISNGELDSMSRIKALEDYFGIQMSLVAEILNN